MKGFTKGFLSPGALSNGKKARAARKLAQGLWQFAKSFVKALAKTFAKPSVKPF